MPKSLGWYLAEQLILKITLLDTKPAIWRRVEVHSGLTLHDLHDVIQSVFDWDNSHLYQFLVTPGGKLTHKALREAVNYNGPMLDDPWADEKPRRAEEALVGRVFTADVKQILYEYDMGDSWQHVIKLEKRTPGGDQSHVPQCLAGENAAPRDDMGGIPGFYNLLEALTDPSHEAHETAIDWLGQDFDPAHFDVVAANQRLAETFMPVPKKKRKGK